MSFSNINQLLDEYYFYLSKENIKKNTVLAYYFDFKNYLDISEAVELDELFKVDYLREFINQSSISESTKKRRLASIKKAYYYLTQNSLIAKDIKFFSNLNSIKIEKKSIVSSDNILSEEEIDILLNTPNDSISLRDKAIIETIYTLGFRTSEIVELKLNDIDLNLNLISVYRNSIKKTFSLNNDINSSLINYLNYERLKINLETDYLFLNKNKEKLSRQSVWKIIAKYAENQNIETKVNPKILRKSFALHLIKNGVSINTVSEIFGIDNLNFLLREADNKQSYIEIKDFFTNK
ncbi:tyrosine-type recombinase/integrase [Acetoanaerobium noterae]|uniref:tyrosine-type recombinase/integrase n=1 Tax=Acetoanaerobium noterae TaxID=745369 RepID=UPI0028B17E14|nr:tyrosine-type recombinase/integrase [Acetoanaerobium noterae]